MYWTAMLHAGLTYHPTLEYAGITKKYRPTTPVGVTGCTCTAEYSNYEYLPDCRSGECYDSSLGGPELLIHNSLHGSYEGFASS